VRRERLSRIAEPPSVFKTDAELRAHPVMGWDFPHLRDGDWTSIHGMPCRRAQSAVDWLMKAGFSRTDACCLICDLYWDAYGELAARGMVRRLSVPRQQPTRKATKRKKTKI
jgi:hypothetical protein